FRPDEDDLNIRFYLTATGSASQAQTSFTDAADANDGDGTMIVSPISVNAASTGNTFTFNFQAPNNKPFKSGSRATIVVPADWTAPQKTNSSNPGFVTVTAATCAHPAVGTPDLSVAGSTITVTLECAVNNPGFGFALTYGGGGTKVTA